MSCLSFSFLGKGVEVCKVHSWRYENPHHRIGNLRIVLLSTLRYLFPINNPRGKQRKGQYNGF
jgi:hypothetical protein